MRLIIYFTPVAGGVPLAACTICDWGAAWAGHGVEVVPALATEHRGHDGRNGRSPQLNEREPCLR
ncbi:MAG: hypothetical protein ACLP19_23875, partial [Xanthobacteraceae bacterium]